MGGVRMLARRELRRRTLGLVLIAVVIAVSGGLVLTAIAGARRTDSAARRLRSATQAADLSVNIFPVDRRFAAQIGALPEVETWGQLTLWTTISERTHNLLSVAPPLDDRFGRVIDRARLISGRPARGPHELVATESMAKALHLRIGGLVAFTSYDKVQAQALLDNSLAANTKPAGPRLVFRVVGVDRRAVDFSPTAAKNGLAIATRAIYHRFHDQVGAFGGLVRVRLRPGASSAHLISEIKRMAHGRFLDFDTSSSDRAVDDSLRVLAIGLLLFGAIAAAGSIAALIVLIARSHSATTPDQPVWYALGLTTRERTLTVLVPALPFVITGAVGAGLIGYLGSAFMPIGLGRRVEPAPGLSFDGLVLGVGVLAVLGVTVLITSVLAWRNARRAAWDGSGLGRPLHPSRVTRLAAGLGAPAPTVIGIRMALEPGRGRTAVAVRPALIAGTLGIIGIVAALVMGASVDRLTRQPPRYGWTFDTVVVGDGGQTSTGGPCGPQHSRLERDDRIASLSVVCVTTLVVGSGPVSAYGFRPLRGAIKAPIVRGRAPRTDHEVALGEKTLADTGAQLGDRIRVKGNHGAVNARVVGTAVFPSLDDPAPLAEGALMSPRVLDRIATDNNSSYNNIVIRWRPGTDVARASKQIARVSGQQPNQPSPPVEIDRVGQLDMLPWVLAAFLAAIALVAVGQAVVTNGRRRRHEFALLATLGFRSRDLRSTVRSQAVALMAVGLVIGIPIGLVFGRWAWGFIARDLGVATDAAVPLGAVLVLAPLAMVVVLVIALIPSRQVTRRRPAAVLRSE